MTATLKTTNIQHESAATANITLTSGGNVGIGTASASTALQVNGTITTTTLNAASINDGPLAGFRNRIINGNGVITQRGSVASLTSGYFSDMWTVGSSSAGVVTGGTVSGYIELDVTTIDSSIAAGDYFVLSQAIEGYNVADFLYGSASAKTATLSFKHKHTKTGTHCVTIHNAGINRNYIMEYTQSVSDTEETSTLVIPGDVTGTWDTTNGAGMYLRWCVATGSTYQGTVDSWSATQYFGTSNQVNNLDSTSNYFRITDVQLEIGSTATPFEQRPYGMELALCQRYYWKHAFSTSERVTGSCANTNTIQFGLTHPVPMRATPTFTSTNVSDWNLSDHFVTIAASALVYNSGTPWIGGYLNWTSGSTTMTKGRSGIAYSAAGTATIALSAEL